VSEPLFSETDPIRIFLVGDSLTRQWAASMKCELEHIHGIPSDWVNQSIRYLQMHVGLEPKLLKRYGDPLVTATEKDYVILNFGHHTGNKLGAGWPDKYVEVLRSALATDFGKIPDHHVLFRTTTVRHFLALKGDWNTEHSEAGGIAPDARAQWFWYGGNTPEQPKQNLLALDVILGNRTNATRRIGIFDTAPMMLPQRDSSFDGSHICLPGPMESWSRMLFHRMETDRQKV